MALAAAVLLTGAADGRPRAQATPSGTDPIDARLARVQAALSSGSARPEDSIIELKAILAANPQNATAHLFLGMAYRLLNQPALAGEARAELAQALTLDPDLVAARFLLAQLYLDIGRPAAARETLATGLEQHPGQPQLGSLLAEAERQLGHPDRAAELARQAVARDPSLLQAGYYLGLALIDLHRNDEAAAVLEPIVAAGVNPADTTLALGTAYLDGGRLDRAIATLTRASTVDPARADIRLALARAYRLHHLPAKARAQLALVRLPGAAGPAVSAVSQDPLEPTLYMERGLLDLDQGRLTAAAAAFEKVLAIDPGNEEAARHAADIRRRLRRPTGTPAGGGRR